MKVINAILGALILIALLGGMYLHTVRKIHLFSGEWHYNLFEHGIDRSAYPLGHSDKYLLWPEFIVPMLLLVIGLITVKIHKKQ